MKSDDAVRGKVVAAEAMVRACLGRNAVWAAPDRYPWQGWTRDFGMAILAVLISLGLWDHAKRHLMSLVARQGKDGSIPILFLDGAYGHLHFLVSKTWRSLRSGKPSFMLRRYLETGGDLGRLTPGTTDSEMHFIIAAQEFLRSAAANTCGPWEAAQLTRASVVAMRYVRANLLDGRGRHVGADWRDTMEVCLRRTPLLSNNALLVHAYDLLGMAPEAAALRSTIRLTYWREGEAVPAVARRWRADGAPARLLLDWPGCEEEQPFDPLGASLAILYGVVDDADLASMLPWFQAVDSPTGVTIQCRHNPIDAAEARVIDRTRGIVTWPFVVGFTVLAAEAAARRSGASLALQWRAFVAEQFRKLIALDGLAEWYDPTTGEPHGAPRQLWSATLTLRALDATRRRSL